MAEAESRGESDKDRGGQGRRERAVSDSSLGKDPTSSHILPATSLYSMSGGGGPESGGQVCTVPNLYFTLHSLTDPPSWRGGTEGTLKGTRPG